MLAKIELAQAVCEPHAHLKVSFPAFAGPTGLSI